MENSSNEIRSALCPTCILCGNDGNDLYRDLRDRLFSAKGLWNLKVCSNSDCGLIWLNPMPLPEDIGKAYTHYYTHAQETSGRDSKLKGLYKQALRRWLRIHYGYPEELPNISTSSQKTLHYLIPVFFQRAAATVRYLPFVNNGRLLDVGCGSGGWLATMKKMGWVVEGVDFDPSAVKAARERGINVYLGAIETRRYPSSSFDAITLNHVIEHVPNPIETIAECSRLLKPGGRLVLFTPNASSISHRFFKQNWRGLEPPRHLHVFSFSSMRKLFDKFDFGRVSIRPHVGTSISYESYLLWQSRPRNILRPNQNWRIRLILHLFTFLENLLVGIVPCVGECLAIVAEKDLPDRTG